MPNKILSEDINSISDIILNYLPFFQNKTVLITGATGLIGSLLVKSFVSVKSISVIACVRNSEKAELIFHDYKLPNLKFHLGDITNPVILNEKLDYIIHCAAVTNSNLMIKKPVELINTSIEGTKNMLELAKEKNACMVYLSSMEMYGVCNELSKKIHEDDIGLLNPLLIRSNYPESKRLCENLCISYKEEYDVNVKIARLAQTFGAGIMKTENRVFAQFARSIIENKNIILHTSGLSEGNYCYTTDCLRGIITILVMGKSGEAYNVSNESCHTTILDMANILVDSFGTVTTKIVFDIDPKINNIYAPENHMILSSDKLRKLGWIPKYGLKESYNRLISFMKDEFY